ncbi:MAG: hypothetical protein HXS44_01615 [Theionarchaea archaeon]|nr:hypothetical protein [Theionarchaea archaeon]
MKIVLSRKGFDASNGGHPSPILPDGRLISLPIPHCDEISYSDLKLNRNMTYYDLMKELMPSIKSRGSLSPERRPLTPDTTCHLDPDVYKDIFPRKKGWKPLFGQAGTAQNHLKKQGVGNDDIFLFFGWFKKITRKNGNYEFETSQDLHVVFAYFQIGDIINIKSNTEFPEWIRYHPHVSGFRKRPKNNTIYIANESLSWDRHIPGAETLNFHQDLVLTKGGCSRSKWDLQRFLRNIKISYHSVKSWKSDHFQSAARGQEFVIQDNEETEAWVKNLIKNNAQIKGE